MSLLVVAPHHDDEIIGCGGLICLAASQGQRVAVVHVFAGTSGVAGESDEDASGCIRAREAALAAREAGYELLASLGFRDRSRPDPSLVQDRLVQVIRKARPDIVLLPHRGESDLEHRAVAETGREAAWIAARTLRPELGAPLASTPTVLYYEVWSAIDQPAFYLDINNFVDRKRKMLVCFRSQMDAASWLQGALGLNAWRGVTMQGQGYVEAFGTEPVDVRSIIHV